MIDVAKPGVIPVVSATMGEAAHLVSADSYSWANQSLLTITVGSPRAHTTNPDFAVRA